MASDLRKWFKSNGLALNLKKTKYMIFSKTRNTELPKPLMIAETLIEHKHEARFLGVIMDESLNWSQHLKTVQSKMARYIGIMYKIKKYLPLNARLQIFHSFVQSHANYCSLVWGFSSKENIELLFRKQKIGMRAVIPGFVNFKYKDGKIPGHTKKYFSEYCILTIHNIIVFNALNFMHKIKNYPTLLPKLVLKTIADDCPISGSTHESCQSWLKIYGNYHYSKSLFFKGPLLLSGCDINSNLPTESFRSFKVYRNNVKRELLNIQSSSDACEWQNSNFTLYNITGLRKSQIINRTTVDYREH